MKNYLVSGLINIETTLKIEKFPLEYNPVLFPFFGIKSNVSGVAINIAKALKKLGGNPEIFSLIANDLEGNNIIETLKEYGFSTEFILPRLQETPQSVILYDNTGKRQIHCDLKNIQEMDYPGEIFNKKLEECDTAILTPINFSRNFLNKAKEMNKTIATDLHVQYDCNDPYCKEFFEYADIIFLSNESILGKEKDFTLEIACKYDPEIIVIGMGSSGVMIYSKVDKNIVRFKSVITRPIVNTIGAGDALFSCFLHYYHKTLNPYLSIQKAIVFASYKIGDSRAAHGFLTEEELDKLYIKVTENDKLFIE